MSEKKKHKVAPKKAPVLTPEEAAVVLAEKQAREAAHKLEQERLQKYQNSLHKMSFRQLRGELRRSIKKNQDPWSVVSLIVLENTQTKENPFAKLAAYPR